MVRRHSLSPVWSGVRFQIGDGSEKRGSHATKSPTLSVLLKLQRVSSNFLGPSAYVPRDRRSSHFGRCLDCMLQPTRCVHSE